MAIGKPSETHASKPYVPIPPQVAEAEELLANLQEILAFLKSTEPDSEKTRQTQTMCQQLEAKLKQVQQRVKLYGSPEPDLHPRGKPAALAPDRRRPEDIHVLTAELSAQSQSGRVSSGPEVMVVQKVLLFSGLAVQLTSQFDAPTVAAVRSFQTRYKLPVSGRIDDKTRPVLNRLLKLLRTGDQTQTRFAEALQDFVREWQLELTSAVSAKLERIFGQLVRSFLDPAHTAEPGEKRDPGHPELKSLQTLMGTAGQANIVSKGPEVALLQQYLVEQGYDVKINETFDLQTFTALKAFQLAQGLSPTGMTDAATCQILNQHFAHTHALACYRHALESALLEFQELTGTGLSPTGMQVVQSLLDQTLFLLQHPEAASWPGVDPRQLLVSDLGPAGQGQKISHGPEVLLLQELLQALDYSLEAHEIYDPATAKAVRTFQGQHKLPLSGLVDARTREALNKELARIRNQPQEG